MNRTPSLAKHLARFRLDPSAGLYLPSKPHFTLVTEGFTPASIIDPRTDPLFSQLSLA